MEWPNYSPEQIESSLEYIFGVDSQLITDDTYYVVEIGGESVKNVNRKVAYIKEFCYGLTAVNKMSNGMK